MRMTTWPARSRARSASWPACSWRRDRAIRLYVTGKITEEQLDHQRRFIGERLERLRARLDEYRTRASAHIDQRLVLERVVEWTQRVGDGLDDLPDEERRELLNLLLDEATIDGENNVTLTLAIPGDGDVVSIAEHRPPATGHRPPDHIALMPWYSWEKTHSCSPSPTSLGSSMFV